MPALQGERLDSFIWVVRSLPQAALVENGGVCEAEGVVVVVCC